VTVLISFPLRFILLCKQDPGFISRLVTAYETFLIFKFFFMKTDLEIQNEVMNELKWLPFIRLSNFNVAVKDGIVSISGRVDSYSQKMQAEKAVLKITGVRAIARDTNIEVSDLNKKDTEIAQSVLNALKWPIMVKVESGTITLEGEVQWNYQKESAKKVVADLVGAREIVNLVKVTPRTSTVEIKNKISAALHRTASVDASNINVEIVGNVVKLRGRVRSLAEKQDAADAVCCSPGITKVENYIQVEQPVEFVCSEAQKVY
jgi:osmotically-inducible protein OsmY